jgi:hypothetical protein
MLRARVVLLTILGAVLILLAFLDVGAPAGCKKADGLYHHGELTAARSAYTDLLGDTSTTACAQKGLRSVNVAQCQRALALEGADMSDKATSAYADIATAEPVGGGSISPRWGVAGSDCALLVPAAVCRAAQEQMTAGLLSTARQDFVALLERQATRECAESGLRAIIAEQCADALALAQAGQTQDATKAFIAVATTEPDTPVPKCALEGLGKTGHK